MRDPSVHRMYIDMIIKSKARNMGSCINFVDTCILKNAIYIVLKNNGAISILEWL